MLIFLLIVIGSLAVLCSYLRKHAVRWLFTVLMIAFWIGFVVLLGFVVGYQSGMHGVHISNL